MVKIVQSVNYYSNLEEIIKRFADPKGKFYQQFRNTMRKYRSTLTEDGIRDLFHDSFIAAKKNLDEGRIRKDTSWNSYLISIGLNLSTHEFRSFGKFDSLDSSGYPTSSNNDDNQGLNPVMKERTEEEVEEYNTPEVQKLLAETLAFMNDTCKKILELTLYSRLKSVEIAVMMNSTADSIKTRRNRCKKKLIEIMRSSLRSLGYEIEDE